MNCESMIKVIYERIWFFSELFMCAHNILASLSELLVWFGVTLQKFWIGFYQILYSLGRRLFNFFLKPLLLKSFMTKYFCVLLNLDLWS